MVFTFAEVSGPIRALVGGKAATLARLFQADYPVPPGLVLSPAAFDSDEVQSEAWTRVSNHLQAWRAGFPDVRFAVRSSALHEDSAQSSVAGMVETVLNVGADEEIRRAIQRVKGSGRGQHAQVYSRTQGVSGSQPLAVIIQVMVPAAMAGVLFTADPVTGSHQAMVGNFVPGVGDKLVAREQDPETFRLKRPWGRYDGPPDLRSTARMLYRLAVRLEKELGGPQEIEWAGASGEVYVLQARPITSMAGYDAITGSWNDSRRGDYLWVNTNFGEALPDVMTPYTWSVFQVYFDETFTLRLPGNHPVGGNIAGRFYLNVSLLASLFAGLGLDPRQALSKHNDTFGSIPEDVEIPVIPFSPWTLVRTIAPSILAAQRRVARNRGKVPDFLTTSSQRVRALRNQIAQATDPAMMVYLSTTELEPILRQASQMLQAAMSQQEKLTAGARRKLTKLAGQEDANAILSGITGGDLASLRPLLGLAQVAAGKLSRAEYMRLYGHRGPHEAELSAPRPAEDPHWIDAQLSRLSGNDLQRAEEMLAQRHADQDATWQSLQLRHPHRAGNMRRQLDASAAAARVREEVRSEVTYGLWALRDWALRAGAMTGLGDAIFFLTWGEILQLLQGNAGVIDRISPRRASYETFRSLPPYPSVIRGRFDPLLWAADPDRRQDIYDAAAKPDRQVRETEGRIVGFPGAPGIVEGLVRRMDSPDGEEPLLPGEILVTATTNIGWTPLFLQAAAVVTDVGAPLSHAAIVARELGLPAVVGCGNATVHLKTGDRVRVNGGQGVVEIL